MPILRGTVSFARFRAEPTEKTPKPLQKALAQALRVKAFEPIDRKGEEDRASGFVELHEPERTEFAAGSLFLGEHALFSFRVERLRVPASALKAEQEKWRKGFEKEKSRPPKRAETAEARETIRRKLRSTALPSVALFDVSWNLRSHAVQIWATSRKVVEEIQGLLEDALHLRLVPQVPAAIAEQRKIPDSDLLPTASLFGAELEARHG
jgi:DNA recombination-dependent growth factor C